jgi:hypothetical protein
MPFVASVVGEKEEVGKFVLDRKRINELIPLGED